MAMLKVNDIHVYYGSIHAVKGVSFEVNEGEIVTLIGANGAGKSTVLNTVSGLLHPRTGSVQFMEQDLKGVAPHKVVERGLAQVPEGRRVFLQMTVEENLEMGAYTQPNSTIAPGIADVYKRFPRLEERRRQVAGTLSGGEQQMLAMGRALMSKPKLIVILGPTACDKSGLGVSLAKAYGGEIVSADSRQVYRGLDLGTGKITAEEMEGVPHHLLDVAQPGEQYSVARF